jgi:hypothetical protein
MSACAEPNHARARLLLGDGLLGRSTFFFRGGKGLDPLVLCEPSLPLS